MKVKKIANAKLRNVSNEYYLIPISNEVAEISKIFIVNTIGMKIWKCIDNYEELTSDSLVNAMSEEFTQVDRTILRNDINSFLEQLSMFKLVEVS